MKKCGTVMGVLGFLAVIALPNGFQAGTLSAAWFAIGEICAISFVWLGAKLTQK